MIPEIGNINVNVNGIPVVGIGDVNVNDVNDVNVNDVRSPQTIRVADNRIWVVNPSNCLLYTSPSPRDVEESRMPSSA